MNKQIITTVLLILIFLIVGSFHPVQAFEKEAGSGARLTTFGDLLVDKRATKLRAFLESYNSPLADEASTFIEEADRHNIDWRLVVAIAGTESTFGKHIPRGSHNAWGWGIPTGAQSGIGFKNWEHGIATVTEGLKKNYVNKGAETIEEIGRIYAASPAWASHVGFFLDKINDFIITDPDFLDVTI